MRGQVRSGQTAFTWLVRAEWKFKGGKSDSSTGNQERVGIVEHDSASKTIIITHTVGLSETETIFD